jgi:zinc/manganese transport system permease protein
VSRLTLLREDASLAAFYLISLALGVLIVSTRGSNVDLMHVLFGTVLAIDNSALFILASIASITAVTLAAIYRPLVVECFDPGFLRSVGGRGPLYHMLFLVLVVLNLVGGFLALGTLMAVGLMMLPAAAARFWAREVGSLAAIATGIGCVSSVTGLLLSYHINMPSGPAIILVAGAHYALSLLFGRYASARTRLRDISHLEA